VQAEVAQPLTELTGADWATGPATGEQPGRGALITDGRLAVTAGDELKDEAIERRDQEDGLGPLSRSVGAVPVTSRSLEISEQRTRRRCRPRNPW
jgi:hypothetical protein